MYTGKTKFFVYFIFFTTLLLSNSIRAKRLTFDESRFAFEIGGSASYLSDFDPATNIITSTWTLTNIKQKYGFSGQFFMVANPIPEFVIKAGFDLIIPMTLKSMQASSGSTIMVTGKTTTYIMNPLIALDFAVLNAEEYRFVIGTQIGYSMLRSSVIWDYSATGEALGYTDFSENTKGTAYNIFPYFGFEYALIDQYSIVICLGYRLLNFKTIYSQGGTTPLLDLNGNARGYNFSGFAGSMGFRLYI